MRPAQRACGSGRGEVQPHIPCPGGIPQIPLECPVDFSTKVFTAIHKKHTIPLEFLFSFVSVTLQFMLAHFPQHSMQREFSSQL